MDDIVFLVLLFLIFIVGNNNYETFENKDTPENELYQTANIKKTTKALNSALDEAKNKISTMVGTLTGDIEKKLNNTKGWIEGCASSEVFRGTVYYMGTCRTRVCWDRLTCGSWSCTWTSVCTNVNKPCRKSYTDKTPALPKWNCSAKPQGYSAPKNPFPKWR